MESSDSDILGALAHVQPPLGHMTYTFGRVQPLSSPETTEALGVANDAFSVAASRRVRSSVRPFWTSVAHHGDHMKPILTGYRVWKMMLEPRSLKSLVLAGFRSGWVGGCTQPLRPGPSQVHHADDLPGADRSCGTRDPSPAESGAERKQHGSKPGPPVGVLHGHPESPLSGGL